MPTKPLTLSEISRLLDTMSTEESMSDSRLLDFIDVVSSSGKELLVEKGVDYVKDASNFISAAVFAEFISQGDIVTALKLLSNSTELTKIVSIAFIYSVGLSITEELR